MYRSHLSDRIWHSVLSLISQSHSVSLLMIYFLVSLDRLILVPISLVSFLVSSQTLDCMYLLRWWFNKKQILLLSSHGRLLYALLLLYVSQHDSLRVRVVVRLSLQQHCVPGVNSLEIFRQASLFGCSYSALFISKSRQRSLAGAAVHRCPSLYTLYSEYFGSMCWEYLV